MPAIYDVFQTAAYRRVQSEEGAYDARCGVNVLATVLTAERYVETYIYTGGGELAQCFPEQDAAVRLMERVRAAGRIDPAYWFCVEARDPNALPDYVLHPERPEYN